MIDRYRYVRFISLNALLASLTDFANSLKALNSTCLANPTTAPLARINPATRPPITGPPSARAESGTLNSFISVIRRD